VTDVEFVIGNCLAKVHTSNLSKAQVTCDSSGPVTLAISVGPQQ